MFGTLRGGVQKFGSRPRCKYLYVVMFGILAPVNFSTWRSLPRGKCVNESNVWNFGYSEIWFGRFGNLGSVKFTTW